MGIVVVRKQYNSLKMFRVLPTLYQLLGVLQIIVGGGVEQPYPRP